MPPITLPYAFDTRRETRLLLKIGLALLAVMLVGGLVMLVGRRDIVGAAGTLVVDAMLIGFGRLLLRVQPGAEGRITRDAVEARAGRVWGIELPGPVGTFALRDFEAVRVERLLVSGDHTTGLHPIERVTLAGRRGTPDVPVLVTAVTRAASPGEALAALLGLPCEVVPRPAGRFAWGRKANTNRRGG